MRNEVQQGQVGTLFFGALGDYGEMAIGISFHLSTALRRRDRPEYDGKYDTFAFWVRDLLLERGDVPLATCVDLMVRGWKILGGAYGFADMFITHRTGLVSLAEQMEAPTRLRAQLSSTKVMMPGMDLRKHISGAYWLNFLNEEHMSKLGGKGRVALALPQAVIKVLEPEGVSIQLSSSPIYYTAGE